MNTKTDKEKAKAYDKVREKIAIRFGSNVADEIFSEFEESEDERIRKALLNEFIHLQSKGYKFAGLEGEEIVTWLEKQGEQKLYVNDNAKEMFIEALERVEEQNNKGYKLTDCDKNSWWEDFKAYTSCIIEQKPAKKVESKFKVGDWIANDYCAGKIIALTDDAYLLDSGQGIPFSCKHNAHLWTIEDAQDGDILAFDNNTIVMFKDLYNATTFHSYCHIEDGLFDVSKDEMPDWWEGEGFHPATKEQCDFLFAKMKEAGYEWNAEKI